MANTGSIGHQSRFSRAGRAIVVITLLLGVLSWGPEAASLQQPAIDTIVVAIDSDATPEGVRGLHVLSTDGGDSRRIATSASVTGFDVSRDGETIVYTTETELRAVNMNGRNDRLLAGVAGREYAAPALSPNGKTVYYATYRADGMFLHQRTIATGKDENGAISDSTSQRMYSMEVSPSGRWLLLVGTSLFVGIDSQSSGRLFEIETGDVELLPSLSENPVWYGADQLLWTVFGGYESYNVKTGVITDHEGFTSLGGEAFAVSRNGSTSMELLENGGVASLVRTNVTTGEKTEIADSLGATWFGKGRIRWARSDVRTDPPTCQGWVVTRLGTPNDDTLVGTPGADVIDGRSGNDRIDAKGSNDVLCGSAGRDRLIGGAGADLLYGGPAKDRLVGNGGDDVLVGGAKDDRLFGGAGNDVLKGGKGKDQGAGGPGADECRAEKKSGCEL